MYTAAFLEVPILLWSNPQPENRLMDAEVGGVGEGEGGVYGESKETYTLTYVK